jgi:microcystin-dependent protein
MPVSYTKSGGQGHIYQVPDYPETADGPKSFKDFADFLDLILPPVGTIMPFVGSAAPTGWLLCEGQEVSSTTYPKLSVQCGTKFGTASAGNFRLPNLKGRVIAGLDSSQTEFDAIGKTGGAKTITLTTSNLPAHGHTATALTLSATAATGGTHDHTVSGTTGGTGEHGHLGTTANNVVTSVSGFAFQTGSGTSATRLRDFTTGSVLTSSPSSGIGAGAHNHSFSATTSSHTGHTHTVSGTVSGSVDNTGSGTAFSVVNPYITMNHIIRAA